MVIIGKIDLDNTTTIKDITYERGGSYVTFKTISGVKVSSKHARELQSDLGFNPLGYYFIFPDGEVFSNSWKCWSSCD